MAREVVAALALLALLLLPPSSTALPASLPSHPPAALHLPAVVLGPTPGPDRREAAVPSALNVSLWSETLGTAVADLATLVGVDRNVTPDEYDWWFNGSDGEGALPAPCGATGGEPWPDFWQCPVGFPHGGSYVLGVNLTTANGSFSAGVHLWVVYDGSPAPDPEGPNGVFVGASQLSVAAGRPVTLAAVVWTCEGGCPFPPGLTWTLNDSTGWFNASDAINVSLTWAARWYHPGNYSLVAWATTSPPIVGEEPCGGGVPCPSRNLTIEVTGRWSPLQAYGAAVLLRDGGGCGGTANSSGGDEVEFEGSARGGLPPYAFAWSFGTGSSVVPEENVTRTYATLGDPNGTLSASDAAGDVSSVVVSWASSRNGTLACPARATTSGASGELPSLGILSAGALIVTGAVVVVHRRQTRRSRVTGPVPHSQRSGAWYEKTRVT